MRRRPHLSICNLQLELQRKNEENDELKSDLEEARAKIDALMVELDTISLTTVLARSLTGSRRNSAKNRERRKKRLHLGSPSPVSGAPAEPSSLAEFLRMAEAEREKEKERDEQKLTDIRAELAQSSKITERDLEAAATPPPSLPGRPQLKSLKSHKWHDTGSGMGGSMKNLRDAPVSQRRRTVKDSDALTRRSSGSSPDAKERLQKYKEQRASGGERSHRAALRAPRW